MSEDTDINPLTGPDAREPAPEPAAAAPEPERPLASRRSSAGRGAWLLALVAVLIAAFALWRNWELGQRWIATQSASQGQFGEHLAVLERGDDQLKRDISALRTRLQDADTVNKGVREELLALGQRSRHLEDAVANLAEQRLTGRDALALNECEYLLLMAQERLRLFHDATSALAAYRLADSALGAAQDPVFASVRQTIASEIQLLEAAGPRNMQSLLDTLERVRGALAQLPAKPETGNSAPASRLGRLLAQFVRVRSDDDASLASRDLQLARSLAAVDVRAAQAAVLAHDAAAYTTALDQVHADLVATFDPTAPALLTALTEIDQLRATPLAPTLPELGSALLELRNLRATRALATPPAAPAATPQTNDGDEPATPMPPGADADASGNQP